MRRASTLIFALLVSVAGFGCSSAPTPASDVQVLAHSTSESEALAALKRLHAAGVAAFPELASHLGDDTRTPALFENRQVGYPADHKGPIDWRRTVGSVCFGIIHGQIEGTWPKSWTTYYALTPENTADWLANHAGLSIVELRRIAASESLLMVNRDIAAHPAERTDLQDVREFLQSRAQRPPN